MRRASQKIFRAKRYMLGNLASVIRGPANGNSFKPRCLAISEKLSREQGFKSPDWWSVVTSPVVLQSPRHHCACKHCLHNVTSLIRCDVPQANDAVIGPRTRRTHIDNLRLHSEHIARPHHIRPAQFINPEADGAFSKVQGSHEEPHRDRCRMPPTCNQSLEDC